ncbi:MAG: hypothetical protein Q8P49_01125 [Candidatus Liptonbacteria bacterium]|nr:hypothetical protein [Candidatus Liptonbacteria bacterium]
MGNDTSLDCYLAREEPEFDEEAGRYLKPGEFRFGNNLYETLPQLRGVVREQLDKEQS